MRCVFEPPFGLHARVVNNNGNRNYNNVNNRNGGARPDSLLKESLLIQKTDQRSIFCAKYTSIVR